MAATHLSAPEHEHIPGELLTRDEAGRRYEPMGLSPGIVRALTQRGELPFYRVGRQVLVDPADVDSYLATRRVEPEAS